MAHKNNKNNKNNQKVSPKTKSELKEMEVEMSEEIGSNNESRKLGKNKKAKFKKNRREE
ncbi:small, acid-soluble spore protein, alpha/beta type [Haloimpatiens sp. FM7330]|uniref:small, acid-soluble spore protein, alpha/beta type n=1 Tax=Haloimpatiens sp. FM7330 TaxID=3298610 RepID=UPI0036400731